MPLEIPGSTPAAPAAPAAPAQPAAPAIPAAPQPVATEAVPSPLAAQPAAPAASATPAAQPLASPNQMVQIPLEQLQAFTATQARLAQIEAEQRVRDQAAQQEQARLMAQRGEIENALNLLRTQSEQQLQSERARVQAVEQAAARYALDGELSRALASANLVPGGAEQLATLWRGNFNAVNENGTYAVRTATYETPAQFVSAQLTRPEYAHFLRAQNPGGGTAAGQPVQAEPTPPANPPAPVQPRNMGEAVIMHMQSVQKVQGDARANMGLGFGLKGTPAAR